MRLTPFFVIVFFFLLAAVAFAQGPGILIEFLKPDTSASFKKGQTVEIEFKVDFPQGSTNQQVEAFVDTGTGLAKKIDWTKSAQGNYVAELRTGYDVRNTLPFGVRASANIFQERISNENAISLSFDPAQISIDFNLMPALPYSFGSRIEKIRINAFYPDGSRVPLKNWEMKPYLEINDEEKRLDLKEDADGSLMADVNYLVERNEELSMQGGRLQIVLMDMVTDRFGNRADNVRKRFEVIGAGDDLFQDFGPTGEGGPGPIFMIALIVAVLAVFTFIVWFLVLRKKKEEKLDELKEEAAVLKEMLKRIEIDYYKRRLTEAEYKSRALDYQTRLDKILAKIKVKEAARTEKQAPEEKPN